GPGPVVLAGEDGEQAFLEHAPLLPRRVAQRHFQAGVGVCFEVNLGGPPGDGLCRAPLSLLPPRLAPLLLAQPGGRFVASPAEEQEGHRTTGQQHQTAERAVAPLLPALQDPPAPLESQPRHLRERRVLDQLCHAANVAIATGPAAALRRRPRRSAAPAPRPPYRPR